MIRFVIPSVLILFTVREIDAPARDVELARARDRRAPAAGGGVRPRTDAAAVMEDITYATKQDPRGMWPTHGVDTLLVRAARRLGQGFIVSARDRDGFVRTASKARAA